MAMILVVDDDPDVRRVARLILENGLHTVIEAADGAEALEALTGPAPDLIVTDLVMPDREGIGLIREIRGRGITVPVLAVSGSGPVGKGAYLNAAVALGADRSLAKPYRARELLAVVEDMLRARHAPPEAAGTG